jgi:hypothetical protein
LKVQLSAILAEKLLPFVTLFEALALPNSFSHSIGTSTVDDQVGVSKVRKTHSALRVKPAAQFMLHQPPLSCYQRPLRVIPPAEQSGHIGPPLFHRFCYWSSC